VIGPGNSNRLAAALLVGAWMAFLGWQATSMFRQDPEVARAHGSKDILAAFVYLTWGLFWGGWMIANSRGIPAGSEFRRFTSAIWVSSGVLFAGALIVPLAAESLWQDGTLTDMVLARLEFTRDVLLVGGAVLAVVGGLRRAGSRLGPAFTTAAGVVLLLAVPLGTPLGLWWLLRVRNRERPASEDQAPALA